MDTDLMTQVAGDEEAGVYMIHGLTTDINGDPLDPSVNNYIFKNGQLVKPEWGAPARPKQVKEIHIESPMAAAAGTDQMRIMLSAMQSLEDRFDDLDRFNQKLLSRLTTVEQRSLKVEAQITGPGQVSEPDSASRVPSADEMNTYGNPNAFTPTQTETDGVATQFVTRPNYGAMQGVETPYPEVEPEYNHDATPAIEARDKPSPTSASARAQRILEANGCQFIQELKQFSRDEVQSWEGVGPAVMAELELNLKESGHFFRI